MFDIGWSEMLVIAVVAIIVVGPKDLPKMLRSFGKVMGNMRRMAGDFQRQFDDAMKEAELDEVKDLAKGKTFAPLDDARKAAEKFNRDVKESMTKAESDVRSAIEDKPAGKQTDAGDDPGAIAEGGKLPEPADSGTAAKSPAKASTKTTGKSADSKPAGKMPAAAKAQASAAKSVSKPASKPASKAAAKTTAGKPAKSTTAKKS